MKKFRFIVFLVTIWLVHSVTLAQSQKPDVITKIDNTKISCRIVGKDASVIKYRKLGEKSVLTIRRSLVYQLRYANGTNEIITPKPKPVPKPDPSSELPKNPVLPPTPPPTPPKPTTTAAPPVDRYQNTPAEQPQQPKAPVARKFSIQLNGSVLYMVGTPFWTSLQDGYGHTIGGGGSVQIDYWLNKRISVGAELGYMTWRTQVDAVENKGEEPFYTFFNNTSQTSALVHLRIGLGNRFYFQPQGGVSQLRASSNDDEETFSVTGLQTVYGGTLGYRLPVGRTAYLDLGAFGRIATPSKKLKTNEAVEPMQYAGFRVGIGLSR